MRTMIKTASLFVSPWKEDETELNPRARSRKSERQQDFTFREGNEVDSEGKPTGVTAGKYHPGRDRYQECNAGR